MIHKRCLEWARRHGASFASEKYILVRFTKARIKHNSACPLILPTSTMHPIPSAHVLGVMHKRKLSWQPHLQHIKAKLATQTNVLTRLIASTWGTFLRVLRLLYTALVHLATTPCCSAWQPPQLRHSFEKGWGKSSIGLETDVSKPSPGHTRPCQYKASRQKWASSLSLSTWMASRPYFA
jgi:hypothetical protein